jgi:aminocarboxymuconate-semialdehyde decarboxylase
MLTNKNRYGLTAARVHHTHGLARRPTTTTIDSHAHIVVPQAGAFANPKVDWSRIPLAHFADDPTRAINKLQDSDIAEIMYNDVDGRLRALDRMGIDLQVVAPAPGQCYYTLDPETAGQAHKMVNEGVAAYVAKTPDRFVGLGTVTLQEPERAVQELEAVVKLGLKGVQILTNVDGEELGDPRFRPFFAKAEALGLFVMMHPNGFTHGDRFTHFYFSNVLGNPLETTVALHSLIFQGTLALFPNLKLMAVHGGGYLAGYSGRIDHAWGARGDTHADLPLPPTTYLRQVYFDTVVFSFHQLAYLIDTFGSDRLLMGTDYPFDMAEFDPIGHVAGLELEPAVFEAITGGNASRVLGLTR